ncbi:DEAD/DEAH box helicase [Balneola vulgaris]|uniref:DEAD/DEAH box helicase n=1 Tax=Balneola vulgaris TaxID=287535 RepID=UPI00036DFA0A|nr:DEAD/DEAH box helicase [Balneola vulgaris]
MSDSIKNQRNILSKLGIQSLNAMQEEAKFQIHTQPDVVLLSPTGTGKTLAFLLPIIAEFDTNVDQVQTMILTPSRELAIQIEQVAREMGTGFKVNAVYGGKTFSKDKQNLQHPPALLIGTPGRVADHLRRNSFSTEHIKTLVIDEFDKSLEIGFEEDMKEIYDLLPSITKKVLTSATHAVEIPSFLEMEDPIVVDFLSEKKGSVLEILKVDSPNKDKLQTLVQLLRHIGDQPGIVFCNFKNSIQRVSDFLSEHGIEHGCFYGGMDQYTREQALVKFRNGTHRLLLATDLAARGLDVPELAFIIHYHLPLKAAEFTHRNGRTARMRKDGVAYVIQWVEEKLPEFIHADDTLDLTEGTTPPPTQWATLHVSGGRKDKISKGDLAGLFFKKASLKKDELGLIELHNDAAFVAVKKSKVSEVIASTNNQRVKKKKVRVQLI